MWVKLCGVANAPSLSVVGAHRPDAVGFVLAKSPRQVDLATLAELLSWVPDNVQRWAVFRTPDTATVRALAGLPLTGVQGASNWSGEGLPEGMAFLPVFNDGEDLLDRVRGFGFGGTKRTVDRFIGAFVLDGPTGGGKGVRADVQRAKAVAALGPLVLAGGMTPDNVADAIAEIRPHAVDVSSGIEITPAVKDPGLVARFVSEARRLV